MSSLTNTNPLAAFASLDDFQPRPKAPATPARLETARTEKVATRKAAQDRGFVIDNLTAVVRAKRTASGKASKSHTLRLYIEDINRFQTWCNDNDYSQAKGFEIMLDKLLSA
jgi:hypothetical protein